MRKLWGREDGRLSAVQGGGHLLHGFGQAAKIHHLLYRGLVSAELCSKVVYGKLQLT
jgi:hypothetical protein